MTIMYTCFNLKLRSDQIYKGFPMIQIQLFRSAKHIYHLKSSLLPLYNRSPFTSYPDNLQLANCPSHFACPNIILEHVVFT